MSTSTRHSIEKNETFNPLFTNTYINNLNKTKIKKSKMKKTTITEKYSQLNVGHIVSAGLS